MNQQKILVVDDEPFNLDILEEILSDKYSNIRFAKDGFDCLETLTTYVPDIILMDVSMPMMDGYQCCKKIKQQETLNNIPVIFISARGSAEERLQGYAAGGADYIVKPFDEDELLLKVERTLEYVMQNKQLASQLVAAKHGAMDGAFNNQELEYLLDFAASLLSISNVDQLLNATVKLLNQQNLSACALIERSGKQYCSSIDGLCTPLELDLIHLLQTKGKVFHFQSRTQFNFTHISVLIKNMPESEAEKRQTLVDRLCSYFVLIDLCYERLMALSEVKERLRFLQERLLAVNQSSAAMLQTLNESNTDIEFSLDEVKGRFLEKVGNFDLTQTQENELKTLLLQSTAPLKDELMVFPEIQKQCQLISEQSSRMPSGHA